MPVETIEGSTGLGPGKMNPREIEPLYKLRLAVLKFPGKQIIFIFFFSESERMALLSCLCNAPCHRKQMLHQNRA
jgi:hypothetical protein